MFNEDIYCRKAVANELELAVERWEHLRRFGVDPNAGPCVFKLAKQQ